MGRQSYGDERTAVPERLRDCRTLGVKNRELVWFWCRRSSGGSRDIWERPSSSRRSSSQVRRCYSVFVASTFLAACVTSALRRRRWSNQVETAVKRRSASDGAEEGRQPRPDRLFQGEGGRRDTHTHTHTLDPIQLFLIEVVFQFKTSLVFSPFQPKLTDGWTDTHLGLSAPRHGIALLPALFFMGSCFPSCNTRGEKAKNTEKVFSYFYGVSTRCRKFSDENDCGLACIFFKFLIEEVCFFSSLYGSCFLSWIVHITTLTMC